MKRLAALLATTLVAVPALAQTAPDRDTMLGFITANQLDSNLYNLMAATIPRTQAGQVIYEACDVPVIETMFENGYDHVQGLMGDVWRDALADVYVTHLSTDDLTRLDALDDRTRQAQISDLLTTEAVVEDLRATLSQLVEEATARQANHMLEAAETLCKPEN